MKDDKFAEDLSALIRELDPPPPAPRAPMWSHIEAARRNRRPVNPSSPQPTAAGPPPSQSRVAPASPQRGNAGSGEAVEPLHRGRRAATSSPQRKEAGRGEAIEPLRRGRRAADSSPQRGEAGRGAVGAAPQVRPGRWVRQARWAAPLAAALLIGIGIGRVFRPAESGPQEAPTASVPDGASSSADLPYRMVAAEHLDAAEALLWALPYDARRGDVDMVSDWAEELLLTTRLLLDSPAANDPHMTTLFQDLELVLAQIASISAVRSEGEVELIEEGIRQNNVLLRVRAATMQRARAGI